MTTYSPQRSAPPSPRRIGFYGSVVRRPRNPICARSTTIPRRRCPVSFPCCRCPSRRPTRRSRKLYVCHGPASRTRRGTNRRAVLGDRRAIRTGRRATERARPRRPRPTRSGLRAITQFGPRQATSATSVVGWKSTRGAEGRLIAAMRALDHGHRVLSDRLNPRPIIFRPLRLKYGVISLRNLDIGFRARGG